MSAVSNGPEAKMARLDQRCTHLEHDVDEIKETVRSMNAKITGMLIALVTASVLFAFNLFMGGFSP